ncbi:hypothetical protein DPMN_036436 [Dreissena polymorpha]|uniref:Uncharacterized protein n=2 Tax=Dreissena polymorpha TaxID=45954 RepID=A0A9D4MCY7_DREPO|nr:hypothetical protein DPMN_036436 [Dreissena polymorpha]
MQKLLVLLICINAAFALDKACPFKPTDLIFVLDGSGSEGQDNFNKQLAFVSNFTNQFKIGQNTTRVALVTFATDVTNEFYLGRYNANSSVIHAIQQAQYPNGETNTHLALDHVRLQSLSPHNGAERNVSKVVFVLTDGHSNEPDATRRASFELKKDPQVTVVAIGIGSGVGDKELREIASDANHTFRVTDFDALNPIKAELTKTTCDTCSHLSDICFVLDSSGSEGSAHFHQQLEFVKMVVNEFSMAETSNANICVVTFSTTSQCEIQLTSYNNKTALLENILNVPYRDGETMTHLGIKESIAQLTGYNARNNANKVMIILTDGRSTEQALTRLAAQQAHRAGIDVFSIGIGSSVDRNELAYIATDWHHVFAVDKFHDLPSIHQDVVDQICAKGLISTTTTLPPTHTKDTCAAHLHCQNGGHCHGQPAAYKCVCPAGFNGTYCENNVCSLNPCGPNGTCQPTTTDARYSCKCQPGYFGTSPPDHHNHLLSCQYYACDIDRCAPHGRCLPFAFYPYYYCECDAGYYGDSYQLTHRMHDCKNDACMYKHCHNMGECIRTKTFPFYRCHCIEGFKGTECQEQINTTHTTHAPHITHTTHAPHTTHTPHAQGNTTAIPVTQATTKHSTVSHVTHETTPATATTTLTTKATTTAATTQAHTTQTTHAHGNATALPVIQTTAHHFTSSHVTTKKQRQLQQQQRQHK